MNLNPLAGRWSKVALLFAGTLGAHTLASAAASPAGEPQPVSVVDEVEEAAAALTVTAEADFNSRYVWRGLAFSDGAVWQPSLAIAYADLSFTVWGNYDLDGTWPGPRWNETDLTLSYSHSWGRWTLGATVQSYLYPVSLGQPNTAEVALQGGYALGEFELILRQTVDVAAYPGAYYGELAPTWTHDFRTNLTLTANATLAWTTGGFTDAYAQVEAGGFYLVSAEAALKWGWTRNLSLRPHLAVSHLLQDALRQSVSEPNLVWVGVAVSLEIP
jgi:hypothetical protein